MDYTEHILTICTTIYKMAENVKANKERCQRVAQRVKALEDLVLTIKRRGPGRISATVENALKELCTTLDSAKDLMMKYSKSKPFMSFMKSSSHEDKFFKVNERLTDNFQALSGALQIEQGDMLYKVFDTVSGRRQDEDYCGGLASTSPTAPMLAPSTMPVFSPTTPMPLPYTMPLSTPTTPIPVPRILFPTSVSVPTAPMPVHGTMAIHFPSTQIIAPVRAQCIVAPMTVTRLTAPMTLSTQSTTVVRSYVVSNSYFH